MFASYLIRCYMSFYYLWLIELSFYSWASIRSLRTWVDSPVGDEVVYFVLIFGLLVSLFSLLFVVGFIEVLWSVGLFEVDFELEDSFWTLLVNNYFRSIALFSCSSWKVLDSLKALFFRFSISFYITEAFSSSDITICGLFFWDGSYTFSYAPVPVAGFVPVTGLEPVV